MMEINYKRFCHSLTLSMLVLSISAVFAVEAMRHTASCDDFARNIVQHSRTDSITMNNKEIDGVWTSSGCETYHGPQFVLRKYIIRQDGRWYADYHHYQDGWCSKPTFTLIMKGNYRIGPRNELDGHNGDFSIRSFVLVPHDEKELINLSKVVQEHCPKGGLPRIRQDKQGRVNIPLKGNFSLSKEIYRHSHCREKFGIHIYTHKLMRIFRDRKTSNVNDKLYFGETPTHHSRRSFRPMSYHYPLYRASSNCRVCRKLDGALPGHTIQLARKFGIKGIAEEWASSSCQTLSGTFMSRYLKFTPADKHGNRFWKLVYYFFLDSSCKVLSYKIAAEGTYSKPIKSSKISGAFEVSFNLTDTKITPFEMLIVGSLRAEPEGTCGVSAKWRAGVTQSVKSTKGCRLFGISIPSIEYDILKTVRTDNGAFDLYTGQSSTNNILHNTPSKRPTSFQLPLRRCQDVMKSIKPLPTTQMTHTRPILIYGPEFTIPKQYFVTDLKTQNSEEVLSNKARVDSPRNSATRIFDASVVLSSMIASIVLQNFAL